MSCRYIKAQESIIVKRTNKIRAVEIKDQRRERLLKFLNNNKPIWKTEAYEDCAESTDWVKAIRKESDNRLTREEDLSDKQRKNRRSKSL